VPDHTSRSKKPRQARLKTVKTLARILKEGGYVTAAVTDGGNLNPLTGLAEGFESYLCRYEGVARKVDQAIECLDRIGDREKPFFLFLHTYQVHGPYLPPEPFRDRFTGGYAGWIRDYCFGPDAKVEGKVAGFTELFARKDEFTPEDVNYLRALYDGEIAYTDQELARFWRRLEVGNLLDDTVVILLSDHGEEFDEHDGFGHTQLYDEILHVPLICMLPPARFEVARNVIDEEISLIDVMPTLLDLLGIGPPPQIQGRSLRMLWEGVEAVEPWPVFAETIDFEFVRPLVTAARFQDKKLISYMQGKHFRLYDLARDRREKTNLARKGDMEGNELLRLLEQWQTRNLELRGKYKASFEEVDETLDPELLKELQQLGY
jgi:arylsulfatase A-like enzyme